MAKRTLTDEERGIILNGISTLIQKNKETSGRADKVATDSRAYDAALDAILRERKLAEELQEVLDTAEEIEIHTSD